MNKYIYYGVDAPGVIRNLLLAGIGCLVGPVIVWYTIPQWSWWLAFIVYSFLLSGISYIIPSLFMLFSSLFGKQLQADRLLNLISWQGNELVLDAGCGRGLLLVKIAQRLISGMVMGVDIWRAEDLSSNNGKKTLINATKAGVANRVELYDADVRCLPFQDNTFDVIVSSLVIHNIDDSVQRNKALVELVRVLKVDGVIIIQDFQYTQEYVQYFRQMGLKNIERSANF